MASFRGETLKVIENFSSTSFASTRQGGGLFEGYVLTKNRKSSLLSEQDCSSFSVWIQVQRPTCEILFAKELKELQLLGDVLLSSKMLCPLSNREKNGFVHFCSTCFYSKAEGL